MHANVCHTHLYNWSTPYCYSCTAVLNGCKSEVVPYTVLACSFGLVSMLRFNCKAMPTNDTDYSCHTNLFNQSYGSISYHIMPLVITSLGGRHTYTLTSQTRPISRKQLHTDCRPICASFNKRIHFCVIKLFQCFL